VLVTAGGGGEGRGIRQGLLEKRKVGLDEAIRGFFGATAAEFFVEASDEKKASLRLGIGRGKNVGAGGAEIRGSLR